MKNRRKERPFAVLLTLFIMIFLLTHAATVGLLCLAALVLIGMYVDAGRKKSSKDREEE